MLCQDSNSDTTRRSQLTLFQDLGSGQQLLVPSNHEESQQDYPPVHVAGQLQRVVQQLQLATKAGRCRRVSRQQVDRVGALRKTVAASGTGRMQVNIHTTAVVPLASLTATCKHVYYYLCVKQRVCNGGSVCRLL